MRRHAATTKMTASSRSCLGHFKGEAAMTEETTKLKLVPDDLEAAPIAKPEAFSLDKFKTRRAPAVANVETLQTALPHHSISLGKDFVRLHPDEAKYWSEELCFVNVPIKGQKNSTLHLIDEELATRFL